MKFSIITAIFFSLFTLSVNAQQHNHAQTEAATATKQSSLSQVLPLYFEIKNALVNGDAALAATKAESFANAMNSADMNSVTAPEMDVFMASQKKLAADGSQLARAGDIQKQRDVFATLSGDMATLIKGVKLSSQPIYLATCPMKKASWLSNEAVIKNPYYGKAMLTCGKVAETIK